MNLMGHPSLVGLTVEQRTQITNTANIMFSRHILYFRRCKCYTTIQSHERGEEGAGVISRSLEEEEVVSERRPGGGKDSDTWTSAGRVSGRQNSLCKGPEAGWCLVYVRRDIEDLGDGTQRWQHGTRLCRQVKNSKFTMVCCLKLLLTPQCL